MLPSRFRRLAKLDVLGITNAVGRRQNTVETDLFRVSDRFEKMWSDGGFTAREQDDDLTTRLERTCSVENFFCVFERRLVDISDLIRIHEARIAHHIAAVGKIDSQNRPTTKLNVGCSVMVNVLVLSGFEIPAVKKRFYPREKRRIGSHHIFKFAVGPAGLSHDDLSVRF